MIVGIGVDLCSIVRMERCCADDFFIRRVFTPDEAAYCLRQAAPARHFAARFAAREAFVKAAGLGLLEIGFHNVSVARDAAGRPSLLLSGRAEEVCRGGTVHLSLSHDGGQAIAFVVIER
ncbi:MULTISPECIES: holo-ACP synthase [Jonquetella]|uniref:Holo-[acyl-carrier-protein] synthase n=1 Tax=Jonquetella anthropi DSM 22815 TaxID=885272 RepID=H0UJV9_9BACT|nr:MULTISPECIES: holo-ACP synthase [Jonquetella]EEX48719.1 holo-[acyl-carrier-protein] synthase [Jonquetella anthropi E3_33 E1]EHM12968.1 holo-(acyl-carrier-protein) synthase [Jonquetella anthropi DSM 22815]ERL23477.1 holo-[acyl-carrier-protein] synthase [Jonquetella sp. BV3C21]